MLTNLDITSFSYHVNHSIEFKCLMTISPFLLPKCLQLYEALQKASLYGDVVKLRKLYADLEKHKQHCNNLAEYFSRYIEGIDGSVVRMR